MIKLGLIGMNIQKSRAPALHRLLAELHGVPLTYELQEVESNSAEAFETTLTRLRNDRFAGCNVTFPFKQLALTHVHCPDLSARRVGSINTLSFDGSIRATNTDYTGFIRAYRHCQGTSHAGNALMLGAGGVGRAVAFGLQELGLDQLYVFDLDVQRATDLAESLRSKQIPAEVVEAEHLDKISQQVDGLINCTPVGHYTSPGLPLDPNLIGHQAWCFDAVYTPLETEFLSACRDHGMNVISGFELFLYQGLDAFEFWTGVSTNEMRARSAFLDAFDLSEV